jgi:hypothetical protein
MSLLMCVAFGSCFCFADVNTVSSGADDVDFAAFRQALGDSDEAKAASMGNSILGRLEQRYRGDAGFRTYKSKLDASEFLAKEMISHLNQATSEAGDALADVFTENNVDNQNALQSIAPAKRFYETSVKLFSTPVAIAELPEQQRSFLAQYYDLTLRILTTEVAKAGQGLAIAEPDFKGTHDYVLVLPLLHASDQKPVNIDVLPRWMQTPGQLSALSDSCLLHFGSPFQAMTLAKQAALVGKEPFSEIEFYGAAAKKCGAAKVHIAVDSLNKALDCAAAGAPDIRVALQFEILQLWLDSGNHALAAGQARKIFESYPDHRESGKAIWQYYYAIVRSNDAEQILARIDEALRDQRCEAYRTKLMFVKWWALRHNLDESAKVAVPELEMLKKYGDDPVVAPILFARATDHLARQEYDSAYELLAQLVDKFPLTRSAAEGTKMLDKLKARLTKDEK